MTIRQVIQREEQTNITTTSDAFILSDWQENITLACILTDGTPTVGAHVEGTLSTPAEVQAGTAHWVKSNMGNHTASGMEFLNTPMTAVRLQVTDGTWTFTVHQ